MIRCPYCGAKNKDAFEYCVRCSEPLEHALAERPSSLRFVLPFLVLAVVAGGAFIFLQRTSPPVGEPASGGSAPPQRVTTSATPAGRPYDASLAQIATQEGLVAFREGDYETAVRYLQEFVEQAPDNPFGHMYLGLAQRGLQEPDAAIRSMQAAFDLVPGNPSFRRYLVFMLRETGQDEAAEGVLRQYIALQPDDVSAKVELARTMRAEGKTEEAIAAIEAVVAQSPDNLDARLELGENLKNAGRTEEAVAAFRRAADASPDSAVAQHAWGVTELAAGNYSQSLKPLQEAVRLDSEKGSFRLALAQAYENLDKIPESLSEYEAFIRLSPNDPLAPKIEKLLARAKAALAERQAQRAGGSSGS